MSLQPQCVRSMRTGVRSRRIGIGAVGRSRRSSSGRMRSGWSAGMAHAEHPLVAAHRADAAAHLVGQRLEAPAADRPRPARWRWPSLGPVGPLRPRGSDRWLPRSGAAAGARSPSNGIEAAAPGRRRARGQVKAVDGVEEEQRADALVEVVARPAEARRARRTRPAVRRADAPRRRRRATGRGPRVRRGDDADELAHDVRPAIGPVSRCGQQFDELREHLVAVLPVERQRELRGQQAVLHADVVAAALQFAARGTARAAPARPARPRADAAAGRPRQLARPAGP